MGGCGSARPHCGEWFTWPLTALFLVFTYPTALLMHLNFRYGHGATRFKTSPYFQLGCWPLAKRRALAAIPVGVCGWFFMSVLVDPRKCISGRQDAFCHPFLSSLSTIFRRSACLRYHTQAAKKAHAASPITSASSAASSALFSWPCRSRAAAQRTGASPVVTAEADKWNE